MTQEEEQRLDHNFLDSKHPLICNSSLIINPQHQVRVGDQLHWHYTLESLVITLVKCYFSIEMVFSNVR